MGGNKFQPTPGEQLIYAFVIFLLLWTFLGFVNCMSEDDQSLPTKAVAQTVH